MIKHGRLPDAACISEPRKQAIMRCEAVAAQPPCSQNLGLSFVGHYFRAGLLLRLVN